jgi:hypothetical protein
MVNRYVGWDFRFEVKSFGFEKSGFGIKMQNADRVFDSNCREKGLRFGFRNRV